MAGYEMNFNQDFTSISVLNFKGFCLYDIKCNDDAKEIFTKENINNETIRYVERLFNSSLVVLVTAQKPNCLKMLHFTKKQDICNCVYPTDILSVRMNRLRLIVCLSESIHIHDIRDMNTLHSINNLPANTMGLCTLSLKSHLAFPVCNTSGQLRIFNAQKLKPVLTIKAHNTPLSNLNFSPNGTLLATASERGTVIRVFCVKNGQRVQEFRRGVKRYVQIASLVFSTNGGFLCVSSNTETVHIFKINQKLIETTAQKPILGAIEAESDNTDDSNAAANATAASNDTTTKTTSNTKEAITTTTTKSNTTDTPTKDAEANDITPANNNNALNISTGGWTLDYFTKTVSSYLIPTQVSDVLAQDRDFATALLSKPGLKHVCGLIHTKNVLKLLYACQDGFLYVYEFDAETGGLNCKQSAHDLRNALEGVIEINLTDSEDKLTSTATPTPTPTSTPTPTTTPPCTPLKTTMTIVIENPDPLLENTYASILKGDKAGNTMTDSLKFRKLCDAIDTPSKLYDELQFPPVAIAARD